MVQWDWSPARSGTTWELHPAGSPDDGDDFDDDDDFNDGDDFFYVDGDKHGHVPGDLGYLYLVDALPWIFETFLD